MFEKEIEQLKNQLTELENRPIKNLELKELIETTLVKFGKIIGHSKSAIEANNAHDHETEIKSIVRIKHYLTSLQQTTHHYHLRRKNRTYRAKTFL